MVVSPSEFRLPGRLGTQKPLTEGTKYFFLIVHLEPPNVDERHPSNVRADVPGSHVLGAQQGALSERERWVAPVHMSAFFSYARQARGLLEWRRMITTGWLRGLTSVFLAAALANGCSPLFGRHDCEYGQKVCSEKPGVILNCSGGEGYYYWSDHPCEGFNAKCVSDPMHGAVCLNDENDPSSAPSCTSKVTSVDGAIPNDWVPKSTTDVDADGIDDILFLDSNGSLHLVRGGRLGKFFEPTTITVPFAARITDAVTADTDGDGRVDIVYSSVTPREVSVLVRDASGAFIGGQRHAVDELIDLDTAADVDRDGIDEVLARTQTTTGPTAGSPTTTIHVLSNLTSAAFEDRRFDAGSPTFPLVLTGGTAAGTFSPSAPPGLVGFNRFSAWVLMPDGRGGFEPPREVPGGMAVADFDGDGLTDILAKVDNGAGLSAFLSQGDKTFREASHTSVPPGFELIAAADVNGDALPDLLTFNAPSSLTVFDGRGDGTFGESFGFSAEANWTLWKVVGDFDGDGRIDVAVESTLGGILVLPGACH